MCTTTVSPHCKRQAHAINSATLCTTLLKPPRHSHDCHRVARQHSHILQCSATFCIIAAFEDDIPLPITPEGISRNDSDLLVVSSPWAGPPGVVRAPLKKLEAFPCKAGPPCAGRALKKREVFLCKAVLADGGVDDQTNALVWLAQHSLPLSTVLCGNTDVPDPFCSGYVEALRAA